MNKQKNKTCMYLLLFTMLWFSQSLHADAMLSSFYSSSSDGDETIECIVDQSRTKAEILYTKAIPNSKTIDLMKRGIRLVKKILQLSSIVEFQPDSKRGRRAEKKLNFYVKRYERFEKQT